MGDRITYTQNNETCTGEILWVAAASERRGKPIGQHYIVAPDCESGFVDIVFLVMCLSLSKKRKIQRNTWLVDVGTQFRQCWRIQKVGKDTAKTAHFSFPVGNIDHLSCLKKMEHPFES